MTFTRSFLTILVSPCGFVFWANV